MPRGRYGKTGERREMIEAFIFDMDGLLVETETVHMRAYGEMLRRHGVAMPPGYDKTLVGKGIRANVERIKGELGLSGDADALVRERNDIYLEMMANEPVRPLPGVAELFDFAGTNSLKRALCTSSERRQMAFLVPRILRALGRPSEPDSFFHVLICGDDVAAVKPAPDIYLACGERLDVLPQNCLVFEDSFAGSTAANLAGMPVVAVPNPFSRDITGWPTPFVLSSLKEALDKGIIRSEGGKVVLETGLGV